MRAHLFSVLILAAVACSDTSSTNQPDAKAPDGPACVPESDAELCSRTRSCESMAMNDNCGNTRTVDCGACSGGNACIANQCRASQCSSFAFPNQTLASSINADGVQDALAAVSADGTSVINQRRNCAVGFTTLLIDNSGLTTTTIDLSANSSFAQTRHTQEGTFAMSGDALTVIGVNAAGTGFLSATRPAKGSSTFTAALPNELVNVGVSAPSVVLHPALSSDGLVLHYIVRNSGNTAVDGIYESVRMSTSALFPNGTRMGGDVQLFGDYVTAMSADKMTLFVQKGFAMNVLTRVSVTKPFTNPNAPAAPPTVPGFRTRPIGDCSTMIGTCTGGCNNEQTCTFAH